MSTEITDLPQTFQRPATTNADLDGKVRELILDGYHDITADLDTEHQQEVAIISLNYFEMWDEAVVEGCDDDLPITDILRGLAGDCIVADFELATAKIRKALFGYGIRMAQKELDKAWYIHDNMDDAIAGLIEP